MNAKTHGDEVLRVTDLVKHYGDVRAVDGVSFAVASGGVFTLLGPNGAGKTTTLEILEGIREANSGTIELFGRRLKRIDREAKQRIGVLLQEAHFEPYLKVREVLRLFAGLFPRSVSIAQTIERVALQEKAGALVRTLSGGQRQRLAVGVALINDPDLVFLDEPTTGLDPQARRNMWGIIEALRDLDKALVLTTHYMEEAESLADTVCILDHGKVIAQGTPRELTSQLGEETYIEFDAHGTGRDAFASLEDSCEAVRLDETTVSLTTFDFTATMERLLAWSSRTRFPLRNMMVRQPNLEDVFLSLTGRRLRE